MSTYLSTGIIVEMTIPTKSRHGILVTLEDVCEKLVQENGFNLALYEVITDESTFLFRLRSDVLESQLPEFLKNYYALMYASSTESAENGTDIIAAIDGLNTSEILDLARSKSYMMFQLDSYCDALYFRDIPFRPSLTVSYRTIILSVEGKALIECYRTHFKFFKKCMLSAFSAFPLISTVQVFLTE